IFADAKSENYVRISPMPERQHRADSSNHKGEKKGRALTYEQAKLLLGECEADLEEEREANPDLKLVIQLGLLAGLRRGEIFALRWSHIDWDRDIINVRQNLFWRWGQYQEVPKGDSKFIFTTPKKKSLRDVDLSPTLKSELRTRYMKAEDKRGLV